MVPTMACWSHRELWEMCDIEALIETAASPSKQGSRYRCVENARGATATAFVGLAIPMQACSREHEYRALRRAPAVPE